MFREISLKMSCRKAMEKSFVCFSSKTTKETLEIWKEFSILQQFDPEFGKTPKEIKIKGKRLPSKRKGVVNHNYD